METLALDCCKPSQLARAQVLLRFPSTQCLAAAVPRSNKSALGMSFRGMCSRMDKPEAVTAAVQKLTQLYVFTGYPEPGGVPDRSQAAASLELSIASS